MTSNETSSPAQMNTEKIRPGKAVIGLLFATVLSLCACAPQVSDPLPPPVDLVWPVGNEIPRIRFVGSITRPEDMKITKSFLAHFWDYIIGQEDNSLVAPYGITGDKKGRLYVVDTFLQKIHAYDPAAGEFHIFPSDDQPMVSPIAVAVDNASGTIYVADSKEGVLKVFKDVDDTSPLLMGKELLQRPTGIAVNPLSEELLVVDTKLSKIFRFDLKTHHLLGTFGERGKNTGKFNHPTHITVAEDGKIVITDALNFRIQIYSAKGVFQGTFGSAGDSPGYFSRPRGVATDSDRNIYVVDALFDNIQIFDKQGRLLMDFGKSGREDGEFWLPAGIYIDANDTIYVADSYNRRIQIFQYLKQDGLSP